MRSAAIRALLDTPEEARVTYLRLEFAGPRVLFLYGNVGLTGDDTESHVAIRLRTVETKISASPLLAGAVLSLSAPTSRRSMSRFMMTSSGPCYHRTATGWFSAPDFPPSITCAVRVRPWAIGPAQNPRRSRPCWPRR